MTDEQKMQAVLEVLNETRRSGKSELAMQLTTTEVRQKVRRRNGFEQFTENDALVTLDYMDGNQVKKVITKHKIGYTPGAKAIARRNGMPTSPSVSVTRWKITQKGVVVLEGANTFTKQAPVSHITVNAQNSQVIVGNNNILSGRLEVIERLTELQQVLSESDALDLETKQDAVADIDSIKAQLGKPNPANLVLKALWSPVALAADVAGAIELAKIIAPLLGVK